MGNPRRNLPPGSTQKIMTLKQFYKRFDSSSEPPTYFKKALKDIQHGLDARFNYLEKRWMIIRWKGSPLFSEWDWVMTVQDPETNGYMELCPYVLRRLQMLKNIFEKDEVLQKIEAEEIKDEEEKSKRLENVCYELAKDTRKILRNEFDGVVSSWNNFI